MRRTNRTWLIAALTSAVLLTNAGQVSAQGISTPPPVSGRRLSNPGSILPADVLARVELIRANVELLRVFMGKPTAPAPLLRVEDAQPREVYSQILNLQRHANRLAFEQVRVVRSESIRLEQVARPVDVFAVADAVLGSILLVKQELGIDTVVAEKIRPESTTPSEVFNATVVAGKEINQLMEQRVSSSDVFQIVTAAVYSAATLHSIIPDGPGLPTEPSFEPNKAPSDVYTRLYRCYDLIREVAASAADMDMLKFEFDASRTTAVLPSDEEDLAALLVEHLGELHRAFPKAKPANRAYYAGRRFAAHVYQRAGLLERILEDLAAASRSGRLGPQQGG
jgi:hypothetical protein